MEMSGLNPEREVILEVAAVVTDAELNLLDDGIDLVVHQPDEVLDGMDAWCTKQHGQSGLTAAVKASALSLAEAEQQVVAYLAQHTSKGASPLCGSSVSHDRRFIDRYMPELSRYLHYRTVDVSSVKELVKRWYPEASPPTKRGTHRALDDILESIGELRFYRDAAFKPRS